MAEISVEVQDDSIIVTMPGTDFAVTYEKRADTPNLVLTQTWIAPHIRSESISEFRAQAFQAAVAKARELDWIV